MKLDKVAVIEDVHEGGITWVWNNSREVIRNAENEVFCFYLTHNSNLILLWSIILYIETNNKNDNNNNIFIIVIIIVIKT